MEEPSRPNPDITVEAAPADPDAATRSARRPACPHRVPWRDMNPIAKYFTLEQAIPTYAALAVAVLWFFKGPAILAEAMADFALPGLMTSAVAVAIAVALAAGAAESLRTARSLHHPDKTVYGLHQIALIAFGVVLIGAAEGREWILLAAVPAFCVYTDHRQSRAILRPRSTCAAEPDLPEGVAAGMYTWTYDDPPKPPADSDEWECPHELEWKHLRPWAIAAFFVHRWTRLGYFFGAAAVVFAIQVNAAEFAFGPIGEGGVYGVFIFVPIVLNSIALHEWQTPGAHRGPLAIYVWAIGAYLLTGALAGWVALVLDRPYLWALAPLALAAAYRVVWKYAVATDRAECRTKPELHPRLQARLKS
ncbi:hypothetical protein [Glycomyces paridis]|uniref:Uncharacterized protein n=1 Tax=Glycomyces paridis TaxID=2126555 RepID=A0A4S8NW06_9ACTN|nr:hypothetical protein [Glycomyces paridis]THV21688.1 hypothetical protein E9998_24720 [Glycomyces paridis]